MAEIVQRIRPIKLQLDSDESLRDEFNAAYCHNVRWDININAQSGTQGSTLNQGNNVGSGTPTQSNELFCDDIEMPTGNNVCTGAYSSTTTKEVYFEVWNDIDNHSIWVSDSEGNGCRKVYEGACLGFRFEPQYHQPAHRCSLFVIYDQGDNGEKTIKSKYYVFTDGYNWQFFIDVETSIATDSFDSTGLPYYKTFYPYCDPCEFIQLGARPPDCPKVLPFDDDTQLQFYETPPAGNNLKDKVWYFRAAFYFTDGRHTVMSPFGAPVFLDGGDCAANAEDIKCFRLLLDAGSALVEKIEVYFSNDGVNWFLYDTINKWDDCMSPPLSPPEAFWERDLALNNYYAPNSDSPACTETGCFSTFTYSWNLLQSPHIDFDSATITINGVEYTNTNIGALSPIVGLVSWLNSLNKGTFTFSNEVVTASSAAYVYGNLIINNSPAETFAPTIAEVEQCGTVNTFIYQFCANKGCEPISTTESNRIFDELPIASVAMTAIDNQVAFGDNLTGYDNFLCPIENIEIGVEQDDEPCETELVTVTIDCVIHNFYSLINNFIYTPANTTDIAFGGLGHPLVFPLVVEYADETVSLYDQKIMNPYRGSTTDGNQGSPGFLGGMRGTNFKAVSQQYEINNLNQTWFFNNVDHNHSTKTIMQGIMDGNYKIQRFVFKIPKGNYIFEMYSHLATGFDDCIGTSTYFLGTTYKAIYNPNGVIGVDENQREILINACDGDVDYSSGLLGKYIVIADLVEPAATAIVASNAKAVCGYLKEKTTNVAVELAHLNINTTVPVKSSGTDAYGFYFASSTADYIIHLDVLDPSTCALVEAHSGGDGVDDKELVTINLYVDNPSGGMASNEFNDCAHELVEGRITDCDGNPISGVNVLLTRTGQIGVTDENGYYTILAHDDANWYAQTGETRKIEDIDELIISQQGICIYNTCGSPGCDTCIEKQHVTFTTSCFHCTSQSPPTTGVVTYNFTLEILSGALTGVKTGVGYEVVIIGYDYIDRNNQAQLIGSVQVPTFMSNGVFAPYHINWAFNGATFPLWVKKLRFGIRRVSYELLLSWDTNKVEFLDAAGNITSPSIATNIKLYIDGLSEFINKNLLNTNVSYQWVKGDRIRIITNGDGTPFLEADNNGLIDLPVSSLVDGKALLIPNDPRLANLTANATFELYRVPACTTEPIYSEQCPTIPVLNGEPTITSGTLDFFDTYMFFRAIPQTDQNGLPTVFISPHRYEHHSPSDFFGDHLATFGRAFVRNHNARQTWLEDEIRYSLVLNENGVNNGLSTFLSANAKNYFTPNCGGIVALKAHTGLMFILYENYYDVINIAQNLLQITVQGNVQTNSDYLGNRQQKIAIVYGCDLRDTGSIIFHNEWLSFVDVQRAAVCLSDYQGVHDITKPIQGVSEGNVTSYWTEKLKYIAQLRSDNQYADNFMYLHAGFYPKKNEIVITSFARTGSPPELQYINHERDYDISLGESMSFNLSGYWSGTHSAISERMIDFGSGANGNQLIVFKGGKPYLSDKITSTGITYLNFFGTQCEPVLELVSNGGEAKNSIQKRWLAIRILCKQSLFYSNKIWTQAQQFSNLPLEESQQVEDYSEAAFLCDANTVQPNGVSAILDGDSLFGSWIKVRFLIDPANVGNYFSIEGIVISATESY